METQHKNRKKANIEIERQKKRKHLMQTLICAGIILVIAAGIGFGVWENQSRQWIMTFDGERIATSDFMFMQAQFGMFGDFEGAREMAFDELLTTLTVINRAERHGITMAPDVRENLVHEAEMQRQWMGADFISAERIADLFSINHIQPGLMDIYVPEYTPDPIQFATELVEYMDMNAEDYASFEAKFVVLHDPTEAVRIFDIETDDFDELVREYSIYYDEEWGVPTIDVRVLISDFDLSAEEADTLMNMQEGERHIIQADDYFLVLYMYDRSEADLEVVEATFRERFIEQRRAEIFSGLVQDWLAETPYTINQRAYGSV